jgi:hypothetical protein
VGASSVAASRAAKSGSTDEAAIDVIQTQAVQPWQFWHLDEHGKGEVKETCFWLDNLPALVPTTPDEPGRHPACWLEPPSPDRPKIRSRTYQGIADAMADQWGAGDFRIEQSNAGDLQTTQGVFV